MAKLFNFLSRIPNFLKEVFFEIKKVNWLSRREVLRYTLIVIGVSLAVAMFLGSLDFLFTFLLSKFVL